MRLLHPGYFVIFLFLETVIALLSGVAATLWYLWELTHENSTTIEWLGGKTEEGLIFARKASKYIGLRAFPPSLQVAL